MDFIMDAPWRVVDANTARLMRNYSQALVNDYLIQSGLEPAIRIEDRLWFNEARESRLATLLGTKLSSSITCVTRLRVAWLTSGLPLSTRDTVPKPTPAFLATSRIVAGVIIEDWKRE